MATSLLARLERLRGRLDALREGRPAAQGLLDRARGLFDATDPTTAMPLLAALNSDLDRVGIHTAADAQLLHSLGVQTGRAAVLTRGLELRALEALNELETRLRGLERAAEVGAIPPGAVSAMERAFTALARAVRIAELFARQPAASGAFEVYARARPCETPPPRAPAVAVAELWLTRARGETGDLLQKRRDLEAAHQLLLRLDPGPDRDRVRRLRIEVAEARDRVRTTPPVRSLGQWVRHVRQAARRDPGAAYASVRALYEHAVEAEQPALARAAFDAASAMMPSREALRVLVERRDQDALARWVSPGAKRQRAMQGTDEALAALAFALDETRLPAFELAAGCARYFDVEEALADVEGEAQKEQPRPKLRRVPYPTQTMLLEPSQSLYPLHDLVLEHPRMMLYDLASGRLQRRTYLDEEPLPKPQRARRTAVRVYVCDASGSMHGARARFRDALVIAELNNLRRKALQGLPFDPVYFSLFNDTPTELARVDNAREATRQLEKLFQDSPAHGQTDITLALMSAFDSIQAARGCDPYLARATVVLVTDGEDGVDLERLRRGRAPIGGVEVAMSFISLGEENADLKSLVLEQRKVGARAFYHHLSDTEIGAARTEFDVGFRTLLPEDVPVSPQMLEALLPHLDALEQLAAGQPVASPRVGVGTFEALFPEMVRAAPVPPCQSGGQSGAGDGGPRLEALLGAIAEAAPLAPADDRAADAVTLLHHLLRVYGWTVPAYLDALNAGEPAVRSGVERVRLLCKPFG